MRIVILGPVVNKKTSGGVAVFNEGLYNGFIENGHKVFLISGNKSTSIDNITIKKKDVSGIKLLFCFTKIAKLLKKIKPDLVISSLHYSLGIKIFRKKYKSCKYVQVLHGFPCEINGWFKAKSINYVAKYSKKNFDYVVTVSFLSYAINKKINKVLCDKIIHNGCNINVSRESFKKEYDFIYIGRLFRDKEVEMIADAFAMLYKIRPDLKFAIAGYGELEWLFKKGKFKDCGITFMGKLSQEEVSNLLKKSKFFISMNPLEPFGIVFCEALVAGCNIITQSTSGFASNFIKKDYYHIADCINSFQLTHLLNIISNNFHEIETSEIENIINYFSYKRVAKEYEELITNK